LPPTHFTKGAASRGACSIRAATAANVVMCSMITYTHRRMEKTRGYRANIGVIPGRYGRSYLASATIAPRRSSASSSTGIGGPNEKRMC